MFEDKVLIKQIKISLFYILISLNYVNTHQTNERLKSAGTQLSPRTINTKYGSLRGEVLYFQSQNFDKNNQNNTSDRIFSPIQPVEIFLGVPYATAPQGSLRFMPPVTPTHWRGIRLANKHGSVCPQKLPSLSLSQNNGNHRSQNNKTSTDNQLPEARIATLKRLIPFLRNQSEDCLNLNIYLPFKPTVSNVNKLPVMVFIHGESYEWGTGNAFDGSILASLGQIIVITINYRMGIFGFFPSSADGVLRGNYGLMDQVAALHWIQENIGQFNGDENNVTLVGHGFGANCVHLLSLSPMAVNLFHRIALMSGSGLNYNAVAANSEMYARHLIRAMHCSGNLDNNLTANNKQNKLANAAAQAQVNTNSPNEILDCLRQKSVEEFLKIELKIPQHLIAFGPVQDNIVITLDPSTLVHTFDLLLSNFPGLKNSNEHSLAHHLLVNPLYAFIGQNTFYASDTSSSNMNPSLKTQPTSSDKLNDKNINRTESGLNNLAASIAGLQHLQAYDMLFGFTRVESPFIFSAHEEKFGIDISRRDRVLRTLVRNLFDYHQQVILLTLINEYTDWSRPVEHPLSLLDSLIDVLSDALIVSPLIKAADFNNKLAQLGFLLSNNNNRRHRHQAFYSNFLNDSLGSSTYLNQLSNQLLNSLINTGFGNQQNSKSKKRSFFYVFNYQSQNSGYPQRIGCQSGEELPYLFGAPLAETYYPNSLDKSSNLQSSQKKQFSYFNLNYTKPEIALSEAVIAYWSNFVKFGDPNIWPHELDAMHDRVKGRFENVYWPQYETSQRKYLFLGMKPKIRDHFHSHRLSYWLHLLPQLQHQADPILMQAMAGSLLAGQPDASLSAEQQQNVNQLQQLFNLRYHLLLDHERLDTYDGIVRPLNFKLRSSRLNLAVSSSTAHLKAQSLSAISDFLNFKNQNSNYTNQQISIISAQRKLTNNQNSLSKLNSAKLDAVNNSNNLASVNLSERSPYSMALVITIALGCGLLLLNLAIFAAVYRQLHRRTKKDSVGTVISKNNSNSNNRHLNTSSYSNCGSSSSNSTNASVLIDNNAAEKETLKRRRVNQPLDSKIRNSFAILDSSDNNTIEGALDCQQCEKNNYILEDDNIKLTTDQLLVAQLDQNSIYATQLNNAYLTAQAIHTAQQNHQQQWSSIENTNHLAPDNSSNHLLDNQIIVTTLRPSPKHCTVNCCDYSYQFSGPVQFNNNPNQINTFMNSNQTNSQNNQSQQFISQHYLVKNTKNIIGETENQDNVS